MKSISYKLLIASASFCLFGSGSAGAVTGATSDEILHYSFDPKAYFVLDGVANAVSGHFDYDVTQGTLENVYYDRGGDVFTTGQVTSYGDAQPVFGDFNSNDYDVYQLDHSLSQGGPDAIDGGTHPSIYVNGAGNFLTTDAPSETAVPEPLTWAMMLTGMSVIGSTMRRRAKVCVKYA